MRGRSVGAVLLGLVLAACTATPGGGLRALPGGRTSPDVVLAAALEPFGACDELLAYFQRHALEQVGPWGLPGDGGLEDIAEMAASAAGAETGSTNRATPVPAPEAGVDYSGTNVQEQGVDEPDVVKTDGKIVVTVARGKLQIVDLDRPDASPATLPLQGWDHELLLDGDRLLVLAATDATNVPGSAQREVGVGPYGYEAPISVLTLVDLADTTTPQVEAQLILDGAYRSARMTEGTARVVLASQPTGLEFSHPEGGGLRSELEATERNRRIISESTIDNWLPYYLRTDRRRGETSEGTLLDCDAVSRPRQFSGLGLLSVLSIDLGGSLTPGSGTAIVASGETVYASPRTLYVTTNRWYDQEVVADSSLGPVKDDNYTTEIHAFDIADPVAARHVASGRVRGHLLNQFSMSEHQDRLRVATTDGSPWSGEASQSFVTILEARDGRLRNVGAVGGLGRGERIYSVRFLGDIGYVVTFRQTDPLYTIDLSDPAAPHVAGELKIRGYSAYLHPVDDDLLLGVGQDATVMGRTLGTQLSLFDVSDPAAPARVAQAKLPGGYSEAEYDHRAFLYWPATGLAVVPVEAFGFDRATRGERHIAEARGFAIRGGAIRNVGRISHAPAAARQAWNAQIRRSLVVSDTLVTVSERGLMVSDLATFAERSFVRFT
ncbi:MAG: beta-propeller domain-containing protein [Actinomycetota bacterium]|nr:beta-propeller domain-containing protein [Actinomycetota bacterium]